MSFKVSAQRAPPQRGLPWQPFRNSTPFLHTLSPYSVSFAS